MIQKIIKVGNSAAITLPKEFMQEAGLKIGEEVSLETMAKTKMLFMKPKKQEKTKSLTPEFYAWLNSITEKYEDTIKELARR